MEFQLTDGHLLTPDIVAAWQGLCAADVRLSNPFMCAAWVQALARHRAVRVLVGRQDGRVVGVWAFETDGHGHGVPVGRNWSDHQGSIGHMGGNPAHVLRAAGLESYRFDHLDDSCALFHEFVSERVVSPTLDLRSGYDAYAAAVSAQSDVLKKTAAAARRIERDLGELRVVSHEPAALDTLIGWKRAQYQRSGARDPFDDPTNLALMRDLVDQPDRGELSAQLSVLYAGERAVAAHLGLATARELAYWLPAYDDEMAKYSPGTVLLVELARRAAASGIGVVDLGRGDEPYKARLASENRLVGRGRYERRGRRNPRRILASALRRTRIRR